MDALPDEDPPGMAAQRLKDVDAAERAFRLKAGAWAFAVGALMGGVVGARVASVQGWHPLIGAVVGFAVVTLGVYGVAMWAVGQARAMTQTLYNPSGNSTPYKPEYSYAQSLVVRGRYAEAAASYELHAIENPADPEPYLHLARLYRDKLQQYEDALTWFRRARTDATLAPGHELYVIQEIIDLYLHKLRTPRKAIPELTLVCQRFPGTPAARAAEQQLAQMRELLARERDQLEPFTAQFLKQLGRSSITAAAAATRSEIEERAVRDALRECGNDAAKAAEQLGVPVGQLREKMRELGIS